MHIRAALPTDAHAIADIHVAAWKSAYRGIVPQPHLDALSTGKREAYWSDSIAKGIPHVFVADEGDGIVGWVAFDRCRDSDKPPHTGEVWAIYVLPEVLGKGIGRELWLRALSELQRLGFAEATLWVLAKNQRACQFYGKAGFLPEPESLKHVDIGGIKLEEIRYARKIAR